MAGIRAALRGGFVAVAVCLLFLVCSSRALAQDEEVDAIIAAEQAEALAAAMAEGFAAEAEAATAVDLVPALGAFTGAADEAVADSSEVIGPVANLSADPVLGDGEFVLRKTHLHVPGYGVPFEVALTYRSRANHQSSVGFGWSHNYARHIEDVLPAGGHDCEGDVVYVTEAMERITFRPVFTSYRNGITTYQAKTADVPLRLVKNTRGGNLYVVTDGSGLAYGFNKVGGQFASLTQVSDAAGNTLTIGWDNSVTNDDDGIVTHVIDTSGRNFFYNYVKQRRYRDPVACTVLGGLLGSWFADPCTVITTAQLMCVSQTQNDCSAPLVSFKQTPPDDNGEFDLTNVLDADGHGPTFSYLSGFPKATYVEDDQLTPACHQICDTQSDAAPGTWSCHNQDVCTNAIDNAVNTLCTGINHPIDAPPNGYSCDTYCGQACQDSSGQPCFADGFDHKVNLNYISCGEEDDFDPGPNKDFWHALCECDIASDLGFCNSTDPSVQAAIAANVEPVPYAEGDGDFCHDVASNADASVAHAEVCPSFSATCFARIGNEINTNNANCSSKCFQDCHEADGAKDANGDRRYAFGRPQDLNHDIVDVHDGDGRLVVHNDYGQDPFEVDFDRVVKNQAGDATDASITYDYHDLLGEQAVSGNSDFLTFFEGLGLSPDEILEEALSLDGGTPVYSVHPDPVNVVPLSQFGSVDICQDSCASPIIPPPLAGLQSAGMLPLSALDPKQTGTVWVGEPIVLSPDGRGTYSIVSGPPRSLDAGKVLWASVVKAGSVRLRATAAPDTFSIEGTGTAVAAVFGPDSKLELQQGPGLNYTAKAPVVLALSKGPPASVKGKVTPPKPAVKKVSGRQSFDMIEVRTAPVPTGLFSTAMARDGISIGTAPLVLERKGNVATLVSPAAGTELAQASSAKGQITIKATGSPKTLALTGPVAAAADNSGRIGIVSLPGGELAVVPLSAVLGTQSVNTGLAQQLADGLLTQGMACIRWNQGLGTTATTVTDVQRPEHAVVVHDLHGVIRTEYYDDAWRLLRNVNRSTGETIDYNFRNGTLHGMRDASGARTCIAADYYGKPLSLTKLPAPNAPGDTTPHVTQYSYTASGALVDYIRDPGLPTQASIHRERDGWDRVVWIDTQIGGAASERTTYSYPGSPQFNGHTIFPTSIVAPDGTTTTIAYDPSGAGPTQITKEVPGSSPLQLFIQYDALGRMVEQGRTGHWGSNSEQAYDPASLVTWEATADALNPGQWIGTGISYNYSRQRFHEAGPRLDRWLNYDALDHLQTVVQVPKDGTPRKSRCERHASDGRLDYAIDPEGIVTHDIYDANNRLVRVDLGHPSNLTAWTNACIAGAPAPIPWRPFPLPIPIGKVMARTSTIRSAPTKITNGQIAQKLPPATFKVIAQPIVATYHHPPPPRPPQPSWPTTLPHNDPGMQTISVRKYAPGGALVSDVDGSGVGKFYVLDGFGRVIDEMNADPSTADPTQIVHHWRGYDTLDRVVWQAVLSGPNLPAYAEPTAIFPGLQSMVQRQYDSTGRVTGEDDWRFANGQQIQSQLAVHTSYAYDDVHRTLTTTIGSHPPRVTTFDTLGRPVSDQLPNGSTRTAVWREVTDGDEQDVTSPDSAGTSITLTEHFDDRGLGTGTRQGTDQLASKVYDSYSQLVSTVTGQLVTTNYTYDDYGRQTGYTIAGAPGPSRIASFAYDGDDRRTAITTTNALGNQTTSFVIDGLNRIIETDAPLARVTTQSYLPGSTRLSNVIDPAGTSVSFAYDNAGRAISQIVKPGSAPGLDTRTSTRSFTYSAFGLNTAAITTVPPDAASGSTVTLSYDSDGHQIGEKSGTLEALAIARVYDDMGGLTSTTLSPTSGTPLVLSMTRDPLGRLGDVSVGAHPLAHLTYAGLGGPTAIDYGARASSPGHGTGVTAHISYDARGRRSGIDVSYGTSGADGAVASWNDFVGLEGIPRARVRQLAASPAHTDLYEIDAAGPLIDEGDDATLPSPLPNRELVNADVQAALLAAPDQSLLTLDSATNWMSVVTQSGTTANQIDATDAYTSVAGVPLSTNAAGETVSTGQANLVFDGLGHLVSATSGSKSVSYLYDALGRRVGETVNAGQSPTSTYFVWDGGVLRATTNSATDASQARVYVSGNGPQDLLAVVDGFGAGATHYVHQGGERSVFALSGDNGLAEGYLYDGFGTMRIFDGSGQPRPTSALGMRLLYQGQLYDPELAMYAMGAREYSPALGRFLSEDPAGFAGGDNLYAFAAGMPLTRIDPTGMASQEAIDDSATKLLTESVSNLGALTIDEEEEATLVTAPFVVPQPELDLEDIPDLTSEAHEIGEFDEEPTLVTTGITPTPLTPDEEAADTTPFELNAPVTEPLNAVLDEDAAKGANSGDLWGPDEPTDPSYAAQAPDYSTLSGHAYWDESAAGEEPEIMPAGKRLLMFGSPGMSFTNELGQAVENGNPPFEAPSSVQEGEPIPPQLKLMSPGTLQLGWSPSVTVITVPSTQSAAELILNGPPGDYYWCGCMVRVDAMGAIIPAFAIVGSGGIMGIP